MILAAGRGLRMRPLTHKLPKPLITVAGKTMLERTFDHLNNLKISKIVVNSHYLSSLLEDFVRINYPEALISHEDMLLETGGGIKKALPLLGKEPFFTLNGDSIWSDSESLIAMEKVWNEDKMDALLLLIPKENACGYQGSGDFFMSFENKLSRPRSDSTAPFVYMGVQIVSPRLFQNAPKGPFSINLLWDKALQKGRLCGYVHGGEWFHISTPEDLQKYEPLIHKIEQDKCL